MTSDEYLEAWQEATGCSDDPERYTKSTLEKYLPKLFEERKFSGIGRTQAGRERALRALWDECGDALKIACAVGSALVHKAHAFQYVSACLKGLSGDKVEPQSKKPMKSGTAGGEEDAPRSPGKDPIGPAVPVPPPPQEPNAIHPVASPQLENGFIRISNEVLDHLMRAGLAGSELALSLSVIRKTWGWSRKVAEISIAEFCQMTDQPERTVVHALKALRLKKLLIVSRGGGRGVRSKWGFNKNWKAWLTTQEVAEIITQPKVAEIQPINSAKNGVTTPQDTAELTAKNGGVSGSKSLQDQEHQSPKYTLKDKRKKGKENPLNPPSGIPPVPMRSKLDPKDIFEIWEEERGPLPTVAIPEHGRVTELVNYLNASSANGDDPRNGWIKVIHFARECHPEHYSKMSPAWLSKDLEHINQIFRGIYNHSFEKGDANEKRTSSRKGHIAGDRADFKKTTGRGFIPKGSL